MERETGFEPATLALAILNACFSQGLDYRLGFPV
jgi:hypothetical protein